MESVRCGSCDRSIAEPIYMCSDGMTCRYVCHACWDEINRGARERYGVLDHTRAFLYESNDLRDAEDTARQYWLEGMYRVALVRYSTIRVYNEYSDDQ